MNASRPFSRREMLKTTVAAAGALAFDRVSATYGGGLPPAKFDGNTLRAALCEQMRGLVLAAQIQRGDIVFTGPCGDQNYRGTWPDDCMWPYIGDPDLTRLTRWPGLLEWLTEAIVDLPTVPDRVEFDDVAVMAPGGPRGAPVSVSMPLHLPSAWTRYLDYAESFGLQIPRKDAWAAVIQRSFAQVPFSFGLVYSNPQLTVVGFGFHDTVRITGLDLMTSLVTYRGLQRAARLFEKEVAAAVREQWLVRAQGIKDNLHRLFDARVGGFLGGSAAGRQVSVWGNGLAYWLADADQKQTILKFYRENKARIFLRGCARQVAEIGGWNGGEKPDFSYQTGGYWATGTGFVLPALAHGDPELAAEVSRDLLDNLTAIDHAEWLDDKGSPNGARKFNASVSMPLIATRSIAEGNPLLDYF